MQLEEYIGLEQSKALSRLAPSLLISIFSVGVLTVAVLSIHFSIDHLLLWLLSVLVLVICRWLTSRKFTSENITSANYKKHLTLFTFWSCVNGLNWGSIAFLFHDPEVAIYSVYLVCVLTGYVSVAGSSTSLYLPAFFAFSIPAILLFFLRFITEGGGLYFALAASSIFYLVVMAFLTRVVQRNFKAAKALEYENQSLLNQVTKEKNRAEQAMIEKNHFLAATSHDLRQPLHAMSLYINALQARLTDPLNINILDKIGSSGNALNDLLHGLLDISRLDASAVENRPQHIKLSTLANYLEGEFSPQAVESNLQLTINVDEQHIVYADPVLLERVLRNLLSNAIKYTKRGYVELKSAMGDSNVQISVNDTGIGVPKDKLDSIFSEFIQVSNPERDRNKGLGLGLSIVKRLCDLQNIKLVFDSRLNQGTNVQLTLALGDAALLPMVKTSTSGDFECLNILCIDDEKDIRDGMEMIINSWKCNPIVVSDGTNALRAVRSGDVKIDIIISDLRLRNEESGITVVQSIREEFNDDIPAIIVTGDTAVDRIELVRDAKEIMLLHKPIQPSDLRQAIENLLNQSNKI